MCIRDSLWRYPHELSGGQRQRIGVARALAVEPEFIVADEPTTALDVMVQAQVLRLLAELQRELGLAIIFITHDLSTLVNVCRRIAVMYAGRVVESAPVRPLFAAPAHPYTQSLLACLPSKARSPGQPKPARLFAIRGQVASPLAPPPGCAFEPRCDRAIAACREAMPELLVTEEARQARCIRVAAALTEAA